MILWFCAGPRILTSFKHISNVRWEKLAGSVPYSKVLDHEPALSCSPVIQGKVQLCRGWRNRQIHTTQSRQTATDNTNRRSCSALHLGQSLSGLTSKFHPSNEVLTGYSRSNVLCKVSKQLPICVWFTALVACAGVAVRSTSSLSHSRLSQLSGCLLSLLMCSSRIPFRHPSTLSHGREEWGTRKTKQDQKAVSERFSSRQHQDYHSSKSHFAASIWGSTGGSRMALAGRPV